MGILEGVLNFGGGLLKDHLNYNRQKELLNKQAELQLQNQSKLMDKSDVLQRGYTKDQYSLQRQGMEQAGMNPLLMAGSSPSQEGLQSGSFSGAPSVSSSDVSAFQGDIGETVSGLLTQSQQRDKIQKDMENQKQITDAQSNLYEAQANYYNSKKEKMDGVDTDFTDSQIKLNRQQEEKIRAELPKIKQEQKEIKAKIDNLDQDTKKKLQETYEKEGGVLAKAIGTDAFLALKAEFGDDPAFLAGVLKYVAGSALAGLTIGKVKKIPIVGKKAETLEKYLVNKGKSWWTSRFKKKPLNSVSRSWQEARKAAKKVKFNG